MSSYPTHLESAKVAALAALFELLVTTEDPIEKRRIATTILRIPDPKPTRATQTRATGSPGALTGQPVQSTPDSRTTENSSSPEPTTQDPGLRTQDSPVPSSLSSLTPREPPREPRAPLRAESRPDPLHLSKPTTRPLHPAHATNPPRPHPHKQRRDPSTLLATAGTASTG